MSIQEFYYQLSRHLNYADLQNFLNSPAYSNLISYINSRAGSTFILVDGANLAYNPYFFRKIFELSGQGITENNPFTQIVNYINEYDIGSSEEAFAYFSNATPQEIFSYLGILPRDLLTRNERFSIVIETIDVLANYFNNVRNRNYTFILTLGFDYNATGSLLDNQIPVDQTNSFYTINDNLMAINIIYGVRRGSMEADDLLLVHLYLLLMLHNLDVYVLSKDNYSFMNIGTNEEWYNYIKDKKVYIHGTPIRGFNFREGPANYHESMIYYWSY